MLSIRRPADPAGRPMMASGKRASICCAPEPAQPREVTVASRIESVAVPDGPFDLTVWLTGAGRGTGHVPGILLIQEIFGVGDYIRAVAEDLAELGYVVAAPDLFWRLKPGHQAVHDEKGVAEALEL